MVRERLYSLLTTLGELPVSAEGGAGWGPSFGQALEGACPQAYQVLHHLRLAERQVVIDDVVTGPAGIVVVGHRPGPGQHGRPAAHQRGAGWKGRSVPVTSAAHTSRPSAGRERPSAVRETLRRAFALRAWLQGTAWEHVPVLAAVCSPPATAPDAPPALVLDGLWVGPLDQLGSWLLAGSALDLRACGLVSSFLRHGLQEG